MSRSLFLLALTFLFVGNSAFSKCINQWSKVGNLNIPNLNLSKIQKSGKVKFQVQGSSTTFTLSNANDQIFAQTPEGNASVTLCQKNGILTASAGFGVFKKEVTIKPISKGIMEIRSSEKIFRASVKR